MATRSAEAAERVVGARQSPGDSVSPCGREQAIPSAECREARTRVLGRPEAVGLLRISAR